MTKRGRRLRPIIIATICLLGLAVTASGEAKSSAWYARGLEKLGFTVFPKPEPLPEYAIQPLGSAQSKLSDQKGKIVLLNFWATWCPPCKAEMPSLEALWKKNKDKSFTIVGVSVGEDPAKVKDFVASQGYSYPIFVDPSGAMGAAFGANAIPTTYILDKTGAAIAGKVGGAEYDSAEAVALFAELASR